MHHQRVQQGHKNQQDGDAVQKHAQHQQQGQHQQQNARGAQAGVHDGLGDRVNHPQSGQREGEDARQRDHDQNHRRQLARFAQDVKQIAHANAAVHDHADKQAVEHGHHGGLGGCEPAHAHAAQNQHWRGQSPGGFAQAFPERRAWQAGFKLAHAVAAGQPDGRNNQRQPGQHPRKQACGKQCGHRSAGHQHRIHNKSHRGRNQNIGRRCASHHAGGETGGVPGAVHGGNHHPTHRCGSGRARAGDAAHEHGHANGHQRQHAGAAPNDGDGKIHQPRRHARAVKN